MGRLRKKRTPLGRLIDFSITVFLVVAIVYLGRDMLRSARFTFLRFNPTAISTGKCSLSPLPKDLVKAWGVLVKNSKKSVWPRDLAQGGGKPSLVVEVLGSKGRVVLYFYSLAKGAYFLAKGSGKQLVFQVDPWTYNRFLGTLSQSCKGGKDGG